MISDSILMRTSCRIPLETDQNPIRILIDHNILFYSYENPIRIRIESYTVSVEIQDTSNMKCFPFYSYQNTSIMLYESEQKPIRFLTETYENPNRIYCPMLFLLEPHQGGIRFRLQSYRLPSRSLCESKQSMLSYVIPFRIPFESYSNPTRIFKKISSRFPR